LLSRAAPTPPSSRAAPVAHGLLRLLERGTSTPLHIAMPKNQILSDSPWQRTPILPTTVLGVKRKTGHRIDDQLSGVVFESTRYKP
jgi:hypothetical protein